MFFLISKRNWLKNSQNIDSPSQKIMSKRSGKRIQEKEFTSSKKIRVTQKKEDNTVNFDAINELILTAHPNLDTKNLELIKFLTIFNILFEKVNKDNVTVEEPKNTEELDSVMVYQK